MVAAMDNDQLITVSQLSSRLQVEKGWIYERTRTRSIPFIKLGKYLRFKWDDVEEWFDSETARGA